VKNGIPSGTKQTAEKFDVLKGHGSRRIVIGKEIGVLKGHGFSRAVRAAKSTWALAPEGCFLGIRHEIRPFSAASKAAPF
jgi:hypothetical protein